MDSKISIIYSYPCLRPPSLAIPSATILWVSLVLNNVSTLKNRLFTLACVNAAPDTSKDLAICLLSAHIFNMHGRPTLLS